MKRVIILLLLIVMHSAGRAQTVDYEAAGKLTSGLILSGINNGQSKLDASEEEYQEKSRAVRDLTSKIMHENGEIWGQADWKEDKLMAMADPAQYLTMCIKYDYYTATSLMNLSIVNTYARQADIPQISTTGNYILFEGKWGKRYAFRMLELEKYVLPDEFTIPICRLSDNTIARQPLVVKAFGFLNDCDKCKNLSINNSVTGKLNTVSIDCDDRISNKNIDSALYYMRIFLKSPNLLHTNVDILDYATVRLWYNMLKLQSAKKTSDIVELIAANADYFKNVNDSNVVKQSEPFNENRVDGKKAGKMDSRGAEQSFFASSYYISDYYFLKALLVYYEVKKASGPELVHIALNSCAVNASRDADKLAASTMQFVSGVKKN